MKNLKTACSALCIRGACIISELEYLIAKSVQSVATIKRNFEELWV